MPRARRLQRSSQKLEESGTFSEATFVVVSCGALNSAKLLLMSGNDKHPNGLANGSGQVGRNYMVPTTSQAALAISLEPNPTIFQKTPCNQ
jgi:Choline dehydrogenase and related flavoproteins